MTAEAPVQPSTLISTVAVFEQLLASTPVTVYVVVTVGLATTLLPVVALKPLGGAHEYVEPPLALTPVEPPMHIVSCTALALMFGRLLTVTLLVAVPVQAPLLPVTV